MQRAFCLSFNIEPPKRQSIFLWNHQFQQRVCLCKGISPGLAFLFWPPRSPDLTPCDFLWGFVKEAVYVPPLPTILDDLKNRIRAAVKSVTLENLLRVWDEFSYRLDVVRASEGGQIEHL
jgi:hypothetical protein